MARIVENLPDNFRIVKQEIEKKFMVRYWMSKERTVENYALLKLLLDNLQKFVEGLLVPVEQKIIDLMTEQKVNTVILGQYGKKLFYDEEANWLYPDEMTPDDWRKYDQECNAEYLRKMSEEKKK